MLTVATSVDARTVALGRSGRWCFKASATSRRRLISATGLAVRRKTHLASTALRTSLIFAKRSVQLSDRIASVFLLLALFGKQIDYLLSV
jgi:hypothetical protein